MLFGLSLLRLSGGSSFPSDRFDLRLLTVDAELKRSSSLSASSNFEAYIKPRAAPILPRKLGFFELDVLFERADAGIELSLFGCSGEAI